MADKIDVTLLTKMKLYTQELLLGVGLDMKYTTLNIYIKNIKHIIIYGQKLMTIKI